MRLSKPRSGGPRAALGRCLAAGCVVVAAVREGESRKVRDSESVLLSPALASHWFPSLPLFPCLRLLVVAAAQSRPLLPRALRLSGDRLRGDDRRAGARARAGGRRAGSAAGADPNLELLSKLPKLLKLWSKNGDGVSCRVLGGSYRNRMVVSCRSQVFCTAWAG